MIRLTNGQPAIPALTLYERTPQNGFDKWYLLEFYSNDDLSSKVMRLGNELSGNVLRFNKFLMHVVVDQASEDLSQQLIYLPIGSTYDYRVYITYDENSNDIDGLSPIESGLVTVENYGSTTAYNESNNIITFE